MVNAVTMIYEGNGHEFEKKQRKIWFRGGNIRGNDVILTQKVKEIK